MARFWTRTQLPPRATLGDLAVAVSALACLLIAIYNDFGPYDGINGSIGVLIVTCSTAALLLPAAAILAYPWPRWLRVLAELWLFADIVGSFVACWFLEMQIEMLFLSLAALGWIALVTARPAYEVSS